MGGFGGGGREANTDDEDEDRVLNREELESQRPVVPEHILNPELVPRAGYYFEVRAY